MLKPKIKNPIRIIFTDDKKVIANNDGTEYTLERGVVYGGTVEHYGFMVVSKQNGVTQFTTYGTQCPVFGVQSILKDGKETLHVLELHKHPLNWIFEDGGKLVQKADFYLNSQTDREYIAKNHKVFNLEEDNLTFGNKSQREQVDMIIKQANKDNDLVVKM